MSDESPVIIAQKALKLINNVEDDEKERGLILLRSVLKENDGKLVSFGYDQVIFRELIKMIQFESGNHLKITLELMESHYFGIKDFSDELAEQIIYRVARTTDVNTSKLCLEKISSLIDTFDESIAKHSKQLLKLADLNEISDLNPILSEILIKLQNKLPKRKAAD